MRKMIFFIVLLGFIFQINPVLAGTCNPTASQTKGPVKSLPASFSSIHYQDSRFSDENIFLFFSQPVYISVSNISGWQPNRYLGGYWLAVNGSDQVYRSDTTPPTGYIGPITSLDVNGDGASQFSFTVTALCVSPASTATPAPTDTPSKIIVTSTSTATPTTTLTTPPNPVGETVNKSNLIFLPIIIKL